MLVEASAEVVELLLDDWRIDAEAIIRVEDMVVVGQGCQALGAYNCMLFKWEPENTFLQFIYLSQDSSKFLYALGQRTHFGTSYSRINSIASWSNSRYNEEKL